MQIENLRGFFSLSLNEQATKEKKQKKVAGIYLTYTLSFLLYLIC